MFDSRILHEPALLQLPTLSQKGRENIPQLPRWFRNASIQQHV